MTPAWMLPICIPFEHRLLHCPSLAAREQHDVDPIGGLLLDVGGEVSPPELGASYGWGASTWPSLIS